MNTTSFIGRLTKDPEVRSTTTGPVADLRVAVDGPNDRAVYVTVTVFGAQADAIAGNVAKGRQVGVTGRLAYDQWESESGELRSKLYVIANSVDFLARPRNDVPTEATQSQLTVLEGGSVIGDRPSPIRRQGCVRVEGVSFDPASTDGERDLRSVVVASRGTVSFTADVGEPVCLLDDHGVVNDAVRGFVRNLVACDYSPATCRSYVLSLLRWLRFLTAVDVAWDRAERRDVRDFVLWMKGADNSPAPPPPARRGRTRNGEHGHGEADTVEGYAPATINHALSAVRMFYEYHLMTGLGPLINPVPAQRGRGGERPRSHRSLDQPGRTPSPRPLPATQPRSAVAGITRRSVRRVLRVAVEQPGPGHRGVGGHQRGPSVRAARVTARGPRHRPAARGLGRQGPPGAGMGAGVAGRLLMVGGLSGRDRSAPPCGRHQGVVDTTRAAPPVDLLGVASDIGPSERAARVEHSVP